MFDNRSKGKWWDVKLDLVAAGDGEVLLKWEDLAKIGRARTRKCYAFRDDLFHPEVPDKFISELLLRISRCPHHFFVISTNRVERMAAFFQRIGNWQGWMTHNGNPPESYRETPFSPEGTGYIVGADDAWPPKNLMLMAVVENQDLADLHLPMLLQIPGVMHGVAVIPGPGPVDLRPWLHNGDCRSIPGLECEEHEIDDVQGCVCPKECPGHKQVHMDGAYDLEKPETCVTYTSKLDWGTCRIEAGSQARPMHPDIPRKLRDDCLVSKVPFFFEGWGRWLPEGQNSFEQVERSTGYIIDDCRYFKARRNAGCLLDGREWNEVPFHV